MESIRRKSRMIETYSILIIDMLSILICYRASLWIRFRLIRYENYPAAFHQTVGLYLLLLCLFYALFTDGNHFFFERGYFKEFVFTIRYNALLMVGLVLILYATQQSYEFSRLIYGIFAILNTCMTYLLHLLFKKYMLVFYRKSTGSSKMLVLTTQKEVQEILTKLKTGKAWNYELTSVILYDRVPEENEKIQDIPIVAARENMYDMVVQMVLDEVFIRLPGIPAQDIQAMVEKFEEMGLVCHYNVDLFTTSSPHTFLQKLGGYSVISFTRATMDSRRLLIKRLVDILGSLVGLTITGILTPFIALCIRLDSPGPIFFSQTRIGKNGRRFKLWKFRSMYVNAEEKKKELLEKNEVKGLMFKMEDDPRITKVGKFLRKTSLDETPQFFNILLGNMSLVGTRPPTVDEFEQYNSYYRRRMSITPGLTGMWQVSGRNEIHDFEEVVKLDLEYIDNWSLSLDLKILGMTVLAVLGRKGSR